MRSEVIRSSESIRICLFLQDNVLLPTSSSTRLSRRSFLSGPVLRSQPWRAPLLRIAAQLTTLLQNSRQCSFLRSSLDVCFPNPPSRPRFPRSLHPRSSCAQPSCTSRRSRCRAQLALVCRHAWRSPKIAWSRAPTRRALPTQMVAELGEMVGVRSKPKIAEDITQLMHACSEKTRAPAPGWQGRLSPTDPPTAAGTRRCSSSGGRAMGSTRRSC